MLLNLFALAVLVLAIVAGLTLLWHRLSAAGAVQSFAVCAHCGASAAAMTSFECPQCRRDVRTKGLIDGGTTAPATRFWRAMALTAGVAFAAMFAAELLAGAGRSGQWISAESDLTPAYGYEGPIEQLTVQFAGTGGSDQAATSGIAWADLYLTDGRVTSMEVAVPSMRARMTPPAGAATDLSPFDEASVRRWLAAAGLGAALEPLGGARVLYDEIASAIRGPSHPTRRSNTSWSRGSRRITYGSSPSGPLIVIVACLGWLLGLRWVLGQSTARAARREDGESAAGKAAA